MVARVFSIAYEGIEVKPIEVQVQVAPGLPSVNIVGLADKEVAESKERIKAAFHSLALPFPQKRVIVNLAPANVAKDGSHYDLPIALGLLVEMQIIGVESLADYIVIGELSLDGLINAVHGVLPAAIGANAASKGLICPKDNGSEATWSGNKRIIAVPDLLSLINHLNGIQVLGYPQRLAVNDETIYPDMLDVKSQFIPKRALEIAAAGGHNLLMIGPPGAGKSMLAKRLVGILPPLTQEEKLEASIIASIAGTLKQDTIVNARPYRAPHSSASMASIVGGGKRIRPGEVTLAHNGVLFLDELPQFSTNVLDSMRQPIEDGCITIARAESHVTYPCRFQLIAAMNPCKCGHFGNANLECGRAPKCVVDYQSKISGPLFDRFDIRVEVESMNIFTYAKQPLQESSAVIAQRVAKARQIQQQRYSGVPFKLNAYAEGEIFEKYIHTNPNSYDILKKAVEKFSLSMRGYMRVLRVARTIADLADSNTIETPHVAEALNFRITRLYT